MKTMIEFKDFSFQYKSQKKPTLHHINLEIKEGEKVLIVGCKRQWKIYTWSLY